MSQCSKRIHLAVTVSLMKAMQWLPSGYGGLVDKVVLRILNGFGGSWAT